MNTEQSDVKLQLKKAGLCTQGSGSCIIEKICCGKEDYIQH